MTLASFRQSLTQSQPPETSVPLMALWFAAKGDWNQAHNLVQDLSTPDAAWVHAYLHRLEGDPGNATYWYSRAGKPNCKSALEVEWEAIVTELIQS